MELYQVLIYAVTYVGLVATFFYMLNLRAYYKRKDLPKEAEDKTVSILIPAYNEEDSIERTIESALAIDYPKERLEIIVVDDGSKDGTYNLAKKYESSKKFHVRVFTKENGGKGSALNLGISKAKNDIIISMDADTSVNKDAVKKMVAHFYSDDVMSVTPSMGVVKPKSLWQRVQHIEYYTGNFLRKSFAIVNSIHITPGAFSAYRKSFFEKYGGYEVGNITEDLEIALRIQKHDYIIENAAEAVVYTIPPRRFRELLVQRRRWYIGLAKNLYRYRELFGFRKGILGTIVLPLATLSILFTVVLTFYMVIKTISQVQSDINLLTSINFNIGNLITTGSFLTKNFFSTLFYNTFTNPIFILGLIFILFITFYLRFARKNMKFREGVRINTIIFIFLYAILYTFWWVVSLIYLAVNKKVGWGHK
ncbi:MAG: glycosyltransferase family 2 protein [Nanoarchaeota archaeon]|nr:glycosyltransferase family 2 protein [Nanoarchaeota archaeon]